MAPPHRHGAQPAAGQERSAFSVAPRAAAEGPLHQRPGQVFLHSAQPDRRADSGHDKASVRGTPTAQARTSHTNSPAPHSTTRQTRTRQPGNLPDQYQIPLREAARAPAREHAPARRHVTAPSLDAPMDSFSLQQLVSPQSTGLGYTPSTTCATPPPCRALGPTPRA
jgi:hypothetical protein